MHSAISRALLISALFARAAFAQPPLDGAPPPLTRFEVINALFGHRHDMFEQNILIDGCSIAKPPGGDSVSTRMGTLAPAVSSAVRGEPGNCYRLDAVPPIQSPPVVYVVALAWRGGDVAPKPPAGTRANLVLVTLRVTYPGSGRYHHEEWLLMPGRNGVISFVSMRTTVRGWSD